MPKRRLISHIAQKEKSKRLKADLDESQMPPTKRYSAPTTMTDKEFADWSDRVAKQLVENLNRNVLQEQREDEERQRNAQK